MELAMYNAAELTTGRLRLRRWQPADAEPFPILNADPRTVQYVPGPMSRRERAPQGRLARPPQELLTCTFTP